MSARLLLVLLCFRSLLSAYAQSISTSITVPPLQWINLSALLQGPTKPPPLKDATIGYDETSRSLIVFGGESQGGFPQSQTYLLNLDTLTWSVPRPPATLTTTPSARSVALGGIDFAASNRHGFVVIGGKGSDGQALSDVWEYDFNNQFWSEVGVSPGGPSPRWGAMGGIDIATDPVQDPVIAGPNNTFYLVGGTDGSQSFSLSDIWRLDMAGTLSSNLPNDALGSWNQVSIGNLPPRADGAGAVLGQHVVAVGGCNYPSLNESCVLQDSYILDLEANSQKSPQGCPVPRMNPVLVANTNTFSTSFSSQLFLLLGTFNESLWSDNGNLEKGEVAVLDVDTGLWSRILPAGDPGSTGTETFPSPRKGAASFAYSSALVGASRDSASDIIVFGGEDATGQYLSEVWILRAYDGTITSSNSQWSGYGDGDLESGISASGTHVSSQFLSECALALSPSNPGTGTSSGGSSPTSTPDPVESNPPSSPLGPTYEISFYHKLFGPLSLTILLPAIIMFRLFSPVYTGISLSQSAMTWLYVSGFLTLISYGMGIAALALSFTTIRTNTSVAKRAMSTSSLPTTHAKISLAFFIGLYGIVPIGFLILAVYRRFKQTPSSTTPETQPTDTSRSEKLEVPDATSSREPIISNYPDSSRAPTPRHRTPSFGTSAMLRPSNDGRLSSDSESISSAGPTRAFEVLNRPPRHRKNSESWLSHPPLDATHQAQRSLADIDWLHRRRSLNAVDELDYAITQVIRSQQAHAHQSPAGQGPAQIPFPSWTDVILRTSLHFFLIGLIIICLIALWARAPRATFAVFLVWVIVMYTIIISLSFIGRPPSSCLTIVFHRLRSEETPVSTPHPEAATELNGPYIHQPSHRTLPSDRQARSAEDDDDDEDEDTRQRRMEREMERREVSIVTVPKRKLWITNPES